MEANTVKQAFNVVAKSYNDTYDLCCKPLEVADRKRTASSANLPSALGHRGTELPPDENAPTTRWELVQQECPLATLNCRGQTLLFTKAGHIWVRGG